MRVLKWGVAMLLLAGLLMSMDGCPPTPEDNVVTYNGNGNTAGSPPEDGNSYDAGETVTVLGSGTLERDKYEFAGWNTRGNGEGSQYKQGDTFTILNDITLYAQWSETDADQEPEPESTYSVTYHSDSHDEGSIPVDSNEYQAGDEVIMMFPEDMLREGYEIHGWNTEPDISGDRYGIYEAIAMPDHDLDLYLQWIDYYMADPPDIYDAGTVTFRYLGDAEEVYVSGSFNDWFSPDEPDPEYKMENTGAGFELDVLLPAGVHQYKYLVDGAWVSPIEGTHTNTDFEPTPTARKFDLFGGYNAVLEVEGELPMPEGRTPITLWADSSRPDHIELVQHWVEQFNISSGTYWVNLHEIDGDSFISEYTAAAPEDRPDLLWLYYLNQEEMMRENLLRDAGDLFDPNRYAEGARMNGSYYGVPVIGGNSLMLQYNKSLLDEPPQTIAQMIDLSEQHMQQHDSGVGLGMNAGESFWFVPFLNAIGQVFAADGTTANLDSPEMITALTEYRELYRASRAAYPHPGSHDYYGEMTSLFTSGELPMIINGDWAFGQGREALGSDFGVAPLPLTGDGSQPRPFIQLSYLSLPAGLAGAEFDIAGNFIDFVLQPENLLIAVDEGYGYPASRLIAEEHPLESAARQNALEQFLEGVPMPSERYMQPSWDAMQRYISEYLLGYYTPEWTAEAFQAAVVRDPEPYLPQPFVVWPDTGEDLDIAAEPDQQLSRFNGDELHLEVGGDWDSYQWSIDKGSLLHPADTATMIINSRELEPDVYRLTLEVERSGAYYSQQLRFRVVH